MRHKEEDMINYGIEIYATACGTKVRHLSKYGADLAAKKAKQEKNLILSTYKCAECGYWHNGKPKLKDNPKVFWENTINQMKYDELLELEQRIQKKEN